MAIAYSSVPFSRDKLADLLSLVSTTARIRWPEVTYLKNSDVAWRLPGSAPRENIKLWYDNHGIAAYAWFSPTSACEFDFRSDEMFETSVFIEIFNWFEEKRKQFPATYPWLLELKTMQDWENALTVGLMLKPHDQRVLQVSALDGHEARKSALRRMGFKPTDHYQYSLTRSLADPIESVTLPDGYTIRSVDQSDFEERVATHRDAWFKSSFTLEPYKKVRAIDIFEPELDLVADNGEGKFGSYCIGWLDRELGIGSFEPVGTRPNFRRLGLGKAVNLEGLRRMRDMGMHSAKIGTACFNDRAFGLYTSCGFKLKDKDRTWVKTIDGR